MQLNAFSSCTKTRGMLRLFVSSTLCEFSMGKQMSSFVLERLFSILQITGVKIALIHAMEMQYAVRNLSQTANKWIRSDAHSVFQFK